MGIKKYVKPKFVDKILAEEAEIIKGLLESNDIRCVIKDGIMGTLAPYIAPSVSVLVTEDQYEAATALIRSRAEKDND